jgi:hypothetical protein
MWDLVKKETNLLKVSEFIGELRGALLYPTQI